MTPSDLQSVLTPPGAGGIAVLAVSGPHALSLVSRIFRFPASGRAFVSGRIHYGHVIDPESSPAVVIDEVIVTYLDPSASCTAQDYFEINCHGGTVPVRSVVNLLARLGVLELPWQRFLSFTVRPAHTPLEWHAYELACSALTTLAARHLFAQFQGALSNALRSLLELLSSPFSPSSPPITNYQSPITRAAQSATRNSQFSPTSPSSPHSSFVIRHSSLASLTQPLLASAPFAFALHQPRTVTVVGLPNVGKSTLANLLVGSDRSLVHPSPGTTRDAVSSLASLAGVPVHIVDTAGLRPTLDEVEAQGVRVSQAKLAAADLVLWVFDHSRPLDHLESSHLDLLRTKLVVPVVNKMDLPGRLPEFLPTDTPCGPPVHTCALTGRGIDDLKSRILHELFGPSLPDVGSPLVFDPGLRHDLENLLNDLPTPAPQALVRHSRTLSAYLDPLTRREPCHDQA